MDAGEPSRPSGASHFQQTFRHGADSWADGEFVHTGRQLRAAGNDLFIEFRNGQSRLVDVGKVTLELDLTMPGAVMHIIGKVMRTATPGQYRTTLDPQMGGDWTGKLGFAGPRGTAETNFPAMER